MAQQLQQLQQLIADNKRLIADNETLRNLYLHLREDCESSIKDLRRDANVQSKLKQQYYNEKIQCMLELRAAAAGEVDNARIIEEMRRSAVIRDRIARLAEIESYQDALYGVSGCPTDWSQDPVRGGMMQLYLPPQGVISRLLLHEPPCPRMRYAMPPASAARPPSVDPEVARLTSLPASSSPVRIGEYRPSGDPVPGRHLSPHPGGPLGKRRRLKFNKRRSRRRSRKRSRKKSCRRVRDGSRCRKKPGPKRRSKSRRRRR